MTIKTYRPANGSEGDWFINKFCCHCKHSDSEGFCPIQDRTMVFDVDDKRYPKEWIAEDGYRNPRCTKFERPK